MTYNFCKLLLPHHSILSCESHLKAMPNVINFMLACPDLIHHRWISRGKKCTSHLDLTLEMTEKNERHIMKAIRSQSYTCLTNRQLLRMKIWHL